MVTSPTWEKLVYQRLTGSPQDPIWHAEGDVATHTRMVVAEMLSRKDFSKFNAGEQDLLHRTALLHDLGKPSCTQHEGGRIRNRGHSRKGAILARGLLYGEGYNPVLREHICALIRAHTVPMHAADDPQDEVQLRTLRASLGLRCRFLTMLAESDNRGRTTPEPKDPFVFNIDYFRELTHDFSCIDTPYPFPTDHSRFLYFQSGGQRRPDYKAHDDTKCEMVMLSGFPGSGKDTWIKKNLSKWPVVSLDDLRKQLKLPHGSNPGPVLTAAKEMFRENLRKRQSFVFHAKNLDPTLRQVWLGLAAQYNARIRIVYLEVPLPELLRRNKTREEAARIPEAALFDMMEKWDIPHLSEAHAIEYHFGGE